MIRQMYSPQKQYTPGAAVFIIIDSLIRDEQKLHAGNGPLRKVTVFNFIL